MYLRARWLVDGSSLHDSEIIAIRRDHLTVEVRAISNEEVRQLVEFGAYPPDGICTATQLVETPPSAGSQGSRPVLDGAMDEQYWGLFERVAEVLRIVRWRMPTPGTQAIKAPVGYWSSNDGSDWHEVHRLGKILGFVLPERAGDFTTLVAGVQHLVDADLVEPPGHAVLAEVKAQSHLGRRAAIILASAAIEIAVKNFLGKMVPGTEWLAENLPTPPIHKILRDYLPSILSKSRPREVLLEMELGSKIPLRLTKFVEELNNRRNRLVHGWSKGNADRICADDIEGVRDLLYLLDFYAGNSWALENMSPLLRGELTAQWS